MPANRIVCVVFTLMILGICACAQNVVIQEIPPAMNLLAEIPISQASGNASAGQPSQGQTGQNQPSHSKADASPLPQVETFAGTVAKGNDGYFLKSTDGASYRLDDATKAEPYSGQNVQITGKLELDTNLIHMQSIKPAQ
jgi:hypothetical protein